LKWDIKEMVWDWPGPLFPGDKKLMQKIIISGVLEERLPKTIDFFHLGKFGIL